MFPVNHRFGNSRVFEEYTHTPNLIIPGEIQHSYWLDQRWVGQNKRLHFSYPIFVWGGSFFDFIQKNDLRGFIPIGDPFLYHLRICSCRKQETVPTNDWALYPQFRRTDNQSERFARHLVFIQDSLLIVSGPAKVFFHPWERVSAEIAHAYESKGFEIQPQTFTGHTDFHSIKHTEYLKLEGLITNYIGPHLFRANLVGVKTYISSLKPDLIQGGIVNENDIAMFEFLRSSKHSDEERTFMSEYQLGKNFIKSPDELHSLFGINRRNQKRLKKIRNFRNFITKSKNLMSKPQQLISVSNVGANCEHCYTGKLIVQKNEVCRCNKCFKRFYLENDFLSKNC